MARPLRIEAPGMWYHVINRGNERGGVVVAGSAGTHRKSGCDAKPGAGDVASTAHAEAGGHLQSADGHDDHCRSTAGFVPLAAGTANAAEMKTICRRHHSLFDMMRQIVLQCLTMNTMTIRIQDDLRTSLQALSSAQNKPVSDIVRESLRRYVALEKFRALRKRTLPFAEAQGIMTDEDVFRMLS